jgi:hypothetical protein
MVSDGGSGNLRSSTGRNNQSCPTLCRPTRCRDLHTNRNLSGAPTRCAGRAEGSGPAVRRQNSRTVSTRKNLDRQDSSFDAHEALRPKPLWVTANTAMTHRWRQLLFSIPLYTFPPAYSRSGDVRRHKRVFTSLGLNERDVSLLLLYFQVGVRTCLRTTSDLVLHTRTGV